MIYYKTANTKEVSHEYVENLQKWAEKFFIDVYLNKQLFIKITGRTPTVCYLGKTQVVNAREFNRLTCINDSQPFMFISEMEIIEVNNENYLEVG